MCTYERRRAGQCCAAGKLSEEYLEWKGIILSPNRWLTVMDYLLNPSKITDYVERNCADRILSRDNHAYRLHAIILNPYQTTIPDDEDVLLCVDNFQAWDTFTRECVRLTSKRAAASLLAQMLAGPAI
jgi:hypothetical protein